VFTHVQMPLLGGATEWLNSEPLGPAERQGVATLFMTDPPIAERMCRLRALDDDQALGLAA
jgi:Zn-dependent protease with chaperone function